MFFLKYVLSICCYAIYIGRMARGEGRKKTDAKGRRQQIEGPYRYRFEPQSSAKHSHRFTPSPPILTQSQRISPLLHALTSCPPLTNGSSPGRSCPCSSSPSAPAPPHLPSLPPPASCCCSGPQQLPTPYPTTITTFVKNVYRFHPCTSTQIISSWPHILKDQGPRRSKSSGREGHTTTSAQQHIINVTCQIFFSTVN